MTTEKAPYAEPRLSIRHFAYDENGRRHEGVKIGAGRCTIEHVVPPAGETYAFDREVWTHNIEVYVSPTGRSVRVFVDGEERTR